MFRQVVLAEKRKTLEELRLLRERLEDLNAFNYMEEGGMFSLHPAEQGTEALERERTYAQIQRLTAYLQKLDEALKRIDNKTYGICRKCGILIAKERLLAVPVTTLSASWKIHQKCPEDGIDRIIPIARSKALQE
jgi:DnaK suppressor protein